MLHLLQNTVFSIVECCTWSSKWRSIFDFLKIFELSSVSLLSSPSESNNQNSLFSKICVNKIHSSNNSPQIQVLQNMVKSLLNRIISVPQVSFSSSFHGVVMMHIILKGFLGRLFHGLWTLIFSFWEILTHIYHCLIHVKNRLCAQIFLPSFQTNIKIIINKPGIKLSFQIEL